MNSEKSGKPYGRTKTMKCRIDSSFETYFSTFNPVSPVEMWKEGLGQMNNTIYLAPFEHEGELGAGAPWFQK
jgi:hypothetical protein